MTPEEREELRERALVVFDAVLARVLILGFGFWLLVQGSNALLDWIRGSG